MELQNCLLQLCACSVRSEDTRGAIRGVSESDTIGAFRDAAKSAFDFLRTGYSCHVAPDEFRVLGHSFMGPSVPIDEAHDARVGDGVVIVRFESSVMCVEVPDNPRLETTCQLFLLSSPKNSRIDIFHVRSFVGTDQVLHGFLAQLQMV
jgi:hypothetical protein